MRWECISLLLEAEPSLVDGECMLDQYALLLHGDEAYDYIGFGDASG